MAFLRFAVLVVPVVTVLAACGESTAFPDPAPCPSPVPPSLPSPTSRGVSQFGPYRPALSQGVQRIEALRADFRSRWPLERPSNKQEFRTEFAAFSDQLVCVASGLRDMQAPTPSLVEFDSAIDRALDDVIDSMAAGREAVRQRNVTRYREWNSSIDGKIAVVSTTLGLFPR